MPDYYPIQSIHKGFLSIIHKPTPDTLDFDIEYFKNKKVNAILFLITEQEMTVLGLTEEPLICQQKDIKFIHYPLKDRDIPEDFKQTMAFIEYLYGLLIEGLHIAVHCRASIGRSGLIASALLIYHGFSLEKALSSVSQARCVNVPDTEKQKEWLSKYARKFKRK